MRGVLIGWARPHNWRGLRVVVVGVCIINYHTVVPDEANELLLLTGDGSLGLRRLTSLETTALRILLLAILRGHGLELSMITGAIIELFRHRIVVILRG